MPIAVSCPACSHQLNASRKYRGKQVKCPKCSAGVQVPGESAGSFFHLAPTPWAAASASPEPIATVTPSNHAVAAPRTHAFAARGRGPWYLRVLRAYIALSLAAGVFSAIGAGAALVVGLIRLLRRGQDGSVGAASSLSQVVFLLGASVSCFVGAALIRLMLGAARDLRTLRRRLRQP